MLGENSNSPGGNQNNPFGFGGGNPFNPFAPSPKPESGGGSGGFNVDDLVKRIDAKIAELEEEERQEKEKLEASSKETKATTITSSDRESIIAKDEHDNYIEQKEKNNGITDDQFFDDFFFDE